MVNLSILFVFVNTILIIQICKNNHVHLFLKILLCISYFGWNAIPVVFSYFPQFVQFENINESYLKCSYLNQLFLFAAYYLSFMLIKRGKVPTFISRRDFQDFRQLFKLFLFLSLLLTIYKCYLLLETKGSYLETNNIENRQATSVLGFVSSYAVYFLISSILFYKSKMSAILFNASVIVVFAYFFILGFQGGRIYLFGLVIILIYYSLLRRRKTLYIVSFLAGILSLLMLPALSSLRGEKEIDVSEALELSKSSTGEMVINSILGKTSSVRSGNYLIEKDGIGNQGFEMYSSTLYALIPRVIYPSKPEPGSVDGEITGLPSRRSAMYSIEGNYNGILNLGVPASLSSLWGGGWIAYFAEIASTALLIFLLNCIFFSRKFIFLCFAIQIIAFPVCILEVPLPSILLFIQRDVVVYLILLFFLQKVSK